MVIRTNFMPGDSVWIMEANRPAKKTITCTRVVTYYNDNNELVTLKHYSFDRAHDYFTSEENVAATKDELKKIIFG